MSAQKNILIVLTSADQLLNNKGGTGWYLPELAHPYYVLKDDFKLTLASPAGGEAPLCPASVKAFANDEISNKFLADPIAQAWVKKSLKLSEVDAKDYDAVFYPGGHGPVIDLPVDQDSIRIIKDFYNSGKITSAVCHAPAVFANVKIDGESFIKGKKFTGFANSEEVANGTVDTIPFLLEDVLKSQGGLYSKAEDWASHVIVDKNLYTGQNPASAQALAEKIKADLLA